MSQSVTAHMYMYMQMVWYNIDIDIYLLIVGCRLLVLIAVTDGTV